ncbi:MAG: hypothetical protein JNJ83_11030 [Verrucomicrobiaceae bacterium]|nr:hypothetical protein [Verrucomicrobiaceae bacterium]
MSDLTPELAGKVLAAHLRNLVKKIGDGGTLTSAEYEMMEKAKADGLLSEELLKARRAALLRKFALGHRLNSDEHAEIAPFIPSTHVVVKRVTSENYKLFLREYVAQFVAFGMPDKKDNVRKLKNWIWHGRFDKDKQPRAEPDFPPFDEPKELASWWRRTMTYKPPDWMTALEKSTALDKPAETPSASTAGAQAESPKATEAKQPADSVTTYGDLQIEGEVANDFAVRILAGAAMDNLRRYNDARERSDWRAARLIREELIDDVKSLQKAKLEAQKLLAQAGDYLHAKKTMQALNDLMAMQDTSFYNALEEAIRVANPQMDPSQRRDLALEYRDKVFEHFQRTEFSEVWTPQNHAA